MEKRNDPAVCGCGERANRLMASPTIKANTGKGSKFPGRAYTLTGNPYCKNKNEFKDECKKRGATWYGL